MGSGGQPRFVLHEVFPEQRWSGCVERVPGKASLKDMIRIVDGATLVDRTIVPGGLRPSRKSSLR